MEEKISDIYNFCDDPAATRDLSVPLNMMRALICISQSISSVFKFLSALASFGAIAIENARLSEHVKKEYEELARDVWKWYDWGTRFPTV